MALCRLLSCRRACMRTSQIAIINQWQVWESAGVTFLRLQQPGDAVPILNNICTMSVSTCMTVGMMQVCTSCNCSPLGRQLNWANQRTCTRGSHGG